MKRFPHSLAPVDTLTGAGDSLQHTDGDVKDGERIWVRSVGCEYVASYTSTATPDGITVVQCDFGAYVWIRLGAQTDANWALQGAWFVDPVGGSDENNGETSATPVKTWSEVRRRIAGNTLMQFTIFTLMNDLPTADRMVLDFNMTGNVIGFVRGTRSTIASTTISAFTNRDPAADQPNELTAPASWASYVGEGLIIVPTSGAAVGTAAFPLKVTGANTVRTTTFLDSNTSAEAFPAPLDTTDVVALTKVASYDIVPKSGRWAFKDLYFNQIGSDWATGTAFNFSTFFSGSLGISTADCAFDWFIVNSPAVGALIAVNCCSIGPSSTLQCQTTWVGGAMLGRSWNGTPAEEVTALYSPQLLVQSGAVLQGLGLVLTGEAFGTLADCAIFDAPTTGARPAGNALTVEAKSVADAQTLWGSGSLGVGAFIDRTSLLYRSTGAVPTIAGTAGEVLVNATPKNWADLPFKDAAVDSIGAAL